MYNATCPDCGATIILMQPGDLFAGCPTCPFYGWIPPLAAPTPTPTPFEVTGGGPIVVPHALAPQYLSGSLAGTFDLLQPNAIAEMLANLQPLQPDESPLPNVNIADALKGQQSLHLGSLNLSAFAEEVYAALGKLTPRELHETPLLLAWDRLQDAHAALYTALGGAHMGDYAPDVDAVGAAIIGVTVAQFVALEAVGRLHVAADTSESEG